MRSFRLVSVLLLSSCGSAMPEVDSGIDSGTDTGSDAPIDPGTDAPLDAPLPACGTASADALAQCVDATRYQTDLMTVAMEREPESSHWQLVQDLCADRLGALGFTVERHAYATGVNVIGVRTGTTDPDHRVLVAAHYDHIPGCDGADDNATGVAGTLEAARVLSMASYPRTLVVACWDEEERGLIGSRAYAERAEDDGEQIDMYFNFEMIGFVTDEPGSQEMPAGFDAIFEDAATELEERDGRGDFIAVVGDPGAMPHMARLEAHADRIGLPYIAIPVPAELLSNPLLGDLRRSDHAPFWDIGVPAVMITDTSEFRYEAYHCMEGDDVVANLDRDFSAQVVRMTVGAAAEALGLGE
jgi:hypothetical protein